MHHDVATTMVVEDGSVDDVICLTLFSLVLREMGGDDDCEVMPSPFRSELVLVWLRISGLNACVYPVTNARGDHKLAAIEKVSAWARKSRYRRR